LISIFITLNIDFIDLNIDLFVFKGGSYVVTFMDSFSTSPALMFIVFFEAFTVAWIYGVDKFSDNINEMYRRPPNMFWKLCWRFITPLIIASLFVISIALFEVPTVDTYHYPTGFIYLGRTINLSIILPVPIYALYKFIQLKMK
jgi:hypothetical protein